MKDILATIIGIVFTGIVILLCLSSCYLAGKSDSYWEDLKQRLDKNKNDRN